MNEKTTYTRNEMGEILGKVKAQSDQETYTAKEMIELATAAGMDPAEVRRAIAQADSDRRAEAQRRKQRAATRVRWVGRAKGMAWSTLVAVACAWMGVTVASEVVEGRVSEAHIAVERRQAAVDNAYRGRAAVPRVLAVTHDGHELAETAYRVENRIHVARADYDRAVAAYNDAASGWFGRRAVASLGYSPRLPYSTAVWGL